ncbi:MAG: hypothetical protein II717_01355 [Lachnospiraceae bacterium]|nr:hypothetical protein [Lachnospiraceae bacterium]
MVLRLRNIVSVALSLLMTLLLVGCNNDTLPGGKENLQKKEMAQIPGLYDVEYDTVEYSKIIPTLTSLNYNYSETTSLDMEFYYHLYRMNHYDGDYERAMTGSYNYLSQNVNTNFCDRVKKDDFKKWLHWYFDINVRNVQYNPYDYFIMEDDSQYYYFYYYPENVSDYEQRAFIYDAYFSENVVVFKADIYYDYEDSVDRHAKTTRDEVLLDPYTEYIRSVELYFDVNDGRLLPKKSQELNIPSPVAYRGIATESPYQDYTVLKDSFMYGYSKAGYDLTINRKGDTWNRLHWKGEEEVYGPDFRCLDEEDMYTKEPVRVGIYPYDEIDGGEYENTVVGYVVFSDNSNITFYADGHKDIKSRSKELTY